jgi:transcriptional regulator with XRE-family HTH domain
MAEDFQMTLARTMRQRREKLAVSQEGFADRIGVHRTYYSSVERGERNVSLKNLLRIADGLGVALSTLLLEAEASTGAERRRSVATGGHR